MITSGVKRRRQKSLRLTYEATDNDEQRLIEQAVKNSLKDVARIDVPVPEAPVFHPSIEEFKNPIAYIRK